MLKSEYGIFSPLIFRKLKDEKKVHLLTKKPLTPLTIELNQNNRSRSAKLRALEIIAQV